MSQQTIKFVGSPCGRHGPYTFYKAFKYPNPKKEGRQRILSLGEFFFAKISQEAPLCCAELQLLWEDKNNEDILLSSVRLYFLPEHTPDGRQVFHGEDEVLADGEKVVLKIEDLLKWIVHPDDATWNTGTHALQVKMEASDREAEEKMLQMFAANNSGLQLDDIRKEKKLCDNGERPQCQIVILSYSQYCRYKAILKRLESVENTWLKNALVCAIGGFTLPQDCDKTYVLFCKDTFEHPELQEHDFRQDHLAPNLKGRPRKKKLNFHKLNGDSSDSETSSLERSFSRDAISKEVKKRHSTRMRGVDLSREEQSFFESLYKFMKERRTPIERIPSLGFKQLDLYAFYSMSQKYGGYDKVCEKKLWKALYDKLGGNPGNTSAATCTRRHYERLLLPFEKSRRGNDFKFAVKDKKKQVKVMEDRKEKLELENKAQSNHSKAPSENNKYGINNKKTILGDRAKHLQVLREHSLQKQQNQRLNVRKTVKDELEMRSQQKEAALYSHIQKDSPHSTATNGIMDKNHGAPQRASELNTNGNIVNGAPLNRSLPPTPALIADHKTSENKVMRHDEKIIPAQSTQVIPLSSQYKVGQVPPNIPQHYTQQHLNQNFQLNQVSRNSNVPDTNGRPSVIQHTAKHGSATYGPPGPYSRNSDMRKRHYAFSDPSSSVANNRQPFPTPPPAHSNSHRSYIASSDPLRNFSAAGDSIKRLRMEENKPPLANHCVNKYKAAPPVKEESKPEVIDLECNETLEPMDFSIRNEKIGDDIKTVVPNAKSDDAPLCLVTHRRIDMPSPSTSSNRRTSNSFQPWQGSTSNKGANLVSPRPHPATPSTGSSHSINKPEIPNHKTSPIVVKPHRPIPHTPSPSSQGRPPSGAGYLYGPPSQSISAGLPAHIAGMSPSPSSSRASSGSSAASQRQQLPPHPYLPGRSANSTLTKPDPKMESLSDSLLHPAFFPMGTRLMTPGMIPLQVAPQLLYPSMFPPTTLPSLGGKDSVTAAGAAHPTGAPSQSTGAQVAPTYLIPVPAQAYSNLYLARPPK